MRSKEFIQYVFALLTYFWAEPVEVGFGKPQHICSCIVHTSGDLSEIQKGPVVADAIWVAPYQLVKTWSLFPVRVPKWDILVGSERLDFALSEPLYSWFFRWSLYCFRGGRLYWGLCCECWPWRVDGAFENVSPCVQYLLVFAADLWLATDILSSGCIAGERNCLDCECLCLCGFCGRSPVGFRWGLRVLFVVVYPIVAIWGVLTLAEAGWEERLRAWVCLLLSCFFLVASFVDDVSFLGRLRSVLSVGPTGLMCSALMVCEPRSVRVVALVIVVFGFALLEHPYIGIV
jgi:hypothetical protein